MFRFLPRPFLGHHLFTKGPKHIAIMLWIKPTWCTVFLSTFISFACMFRQLCANHQERQLYLCDSWYLLFCMDDCLVCRSICSCIPDSHLFLFCICLGRLRTLHQDKQLYLCDTLYLLFCVDDCLVCRSICSCIPDSHPHRITNTKCRINTVISLDDGHIVGRKT